MSQRVLNPHYQQKTNPVIKTVHYAKPIVLPTQYINDSTSEYSFQSNDYSSTTQTKQYSTTTQSKQIYTQTYQTYTNPNNPIYYNYTQNNNNINNLNNNYLGEFERQTYKNNHNTKIVENYGLIDQNNLQNIQLQKRSSAGIAQNYNQNINMKVNMKATPNANNINNIIYQEKKVNYVQPQQNNIITNANINNYYNNNLNNNNINYNIYN